MGLLEKFLPKEDRAAALLLYGMVLATCFNGMNYVRISATLDSDSFKVTTLAS